MDDSSRNLRSWVNEQWPHLNMNDFALNLEYCQPEGELPHWQALSGDAGFRRYYRLASEPSLLAVYAPPETEDMTAFIDIAHHLRSHGVLVPAIAAFDKTQGFMLIEDLGDSLLFDELNLDTVSVLYGESLKTLLHIQLASTDTGILPKYGEVKLLDEMALFSQWFVPQLLDYELNSEESHMLQQWFSLLAQSAAEQPQVVVHRDYHSRNLIYREDGPLGVIDFQDAVVGPMTYDLVSLLRDCYIQWPDDKVREWALSYLHCAVASGVTKSVDEQQFMQWFDWMGLQRHIKVLGIFARLSLRDGKHGYLNDLPLVIEYVLRVSKSFPEALPFVSWFEQTLMPIIIRQPWYVLNSDQES